jgi:hypothetical protein
MSAITQFDQAVVVAEPQAPRMRTADAIAGVVRARAKLRAAWIERLWSEGQTSVDQGLAITPAEVKRILLEPEFEAERFRQFLSEDEPGRLLDVALAAEDLLDSDPFFQRLTQLFELTSAERDLLCLLIAVELDPKLERVLAYLADDTRATRPTAWIAAELFGRREPGTMSGLLRWHLAAPADGEQAWQARAAWQLDEAVLLSIEAEQWVDPSLARFAKTISPTQVSDLACLYPELLARMVAEIPQLGDHAAAGANRDAAQTVEPAVCEAALIGPDGSGRETLAAQFAATRGQALLSVKTPLLLGSSAPATNPPDAPTFTPQTTGAKSTLVRAVRMAHATGAMLYWRDAEGISAADWSELRELAGLSLRGAQRAPRTATHRFALRPLTTERRVEAWAHFSSAPVSAIVRTQRLTPFEIKLAAEAGDEAAAQAAMRRATPADGELLHALPCPYTWDDLVLAPELRRTLESFEAQVRLRWEVYEDWGFQRLTHLGQGISALFGGPSGTGKTMAAQVLARSLGLELYRVDLAGVVNKYIGETEKRLRDVFDACERSGALLFFDEADALFGSRMQVKDSHDRFANIEIDYLLQRIEQFDGVAILATNRKNDLDSAFLRRLRFVVDFIPPSKAERLILWQKALPARAPSGEIICGEIDFELLAKELEVNGAQIKGIALGAAFFARQEATRIGMSQIERSAQREYIKQGLRLRTPIGKGGLL